MNICLIVTFYAGIRDGGQQKLYSEYLRCQKEVLHRYHNSLAKVLFVIARDDIVETTTEDIDGITYIYRKNGGLSFGSWVEAMQLFPIYDYYILCEDDYMFMMDSFDSILVEEYEKKNVDYVVTYRDPSATSSRFSSELISTIGILSKKTLQKYNYFRDISLIVKKSTAMSIFLRTFSSISGISYEYNMFPYWEFNTNNIEYYSNDTRISSEDNKKRVLLGCYQYYILNV